MHSKTLAFELEKTMKENHLNLLETLNSNEDLKKLSRSEMEQLAKEIREFLVAKVSKTGGHLAPNLGVVEITLALHRVFDSPRDSFIWDVGHQVYVHKILTGRRDDFSTLRQKDGLSGFPKPQESEHDIIHAGHSSTSLSVAAGIAQAKRLEGNKSATIAVIGDGSFTAGMVYEALNTLSHQKLPVIIILNDNGMSISENVGGISNYFDHIRTSRPYLRFKNKFQRLLEKIPGVGCMMKKSLYGIKESIKEGIIPGKFFQDLGISYYGPYNGHHLEDLEKLFSEFKNIDKPILIHLHTIKGKGFLPSESDPTSYHGIGPVCSDDDSIPLQKSGISYSKVFGEKMLKLSEKDEKICAITAAMSTGTGLCDFSHTYPNRFYDVGIAEQHAVTFSAGLAIRGFKPVVAIYSTFLQRAYDQVMHDVGIGNYGVLFCLDRAGLVPGDGETHQGIFDIAFLRTVPNMSILLPSTKSELEMMMEESLSRLSSPIAIRYPKEIASDPKNIPPLEWGEGALYEEGKDVILVSCGALLENCLSAREELKSEKTDAAVFNLRFAKPSSEKTLKFLSSDSRPVLFIEEGIEKGGIAESLAFEILKKNQKKKIRVLAVPDEFPPVGTRDELLKKYGFSARNIKNVALNLINS